MIFRLHTWAVVIATTLLLILSLIRVPYMLEIVIVTMGTLISLIIIACSAFLNKVNTNYANALQSYTASGSEADDQ